MNRRKAELSRWIPGLLLLIVGLIWLQLDTVIYAVGAAKTNASSHLLPPKDIACLPEGNKTDQVRIQWTDTNDNSAHYNVYRKAEKATNWEAPIKTNKTTKNRDYWGNWYWVDKEAGTGDYHYRVTATNGNTETKPSEICREPEVEDSTEGNYRIFYRLDGCPDYKGEQACLTKANKDDQGRKYNLKHEKEHAQQVLETSEKYLFELTSTIKFKDPSFFNGEKPFPIDFIPCDLPNAAGCFHNDYGIKLEPKYFEKQDYDPAMGSGEDFEISLVGHEIFHSVQHLYGRSADPHYKWLIEGQAKSAEDKICIFDTKEQCEIWDEKAEKSYLGRVEEYLSKPEVSLLEQSYSAALFWTYVAEQFADTTTPTTTLDYGMDVLLKYWEQNEKNVANGKGKDGITTLNEILDKEIPTNRRFEDIFQDFAVANYAKNLITVTDSLTNFNYIDEDTCPTCSYEPVTRTVETLSKDQPIFGTTAVDAWGARYFEIDLDPAVSKVHIEVETLAEKPDGTPHSLYYHVLGIKNETIDPDKQWSSQGRNFSESVDNDNGDYDRLALIVVGLEHNVNFNYSFNLTDALVILTPDQQFPADAGEKSSPKKVMLQLEVVDADQKPVGGIDTSQFTITVGSQVVNPPIDPKKNRIVASTYNAGKYWLVLDPPENPSCTTCDLRIEYGPYSDTKKQAIVYGQPSKTDNMLIIDRSGSMGDGSKMEAAKNAAALYVDSYDEGDRIGIISYNDKPKEEFSLTEWSKDTSKDAQTAIENLKPEGETAIGAALREGMGQLGAQKNPNSEWAMVLLSDGKDTVAEEKDHIPEFLSEYDDRKDDGDKVPQIHVVAIGDDADGVALEPVAGKTGLFQWLPENSSNRASFALDLADIYRVFAETVRGEQRIYASQDVVVMDKRITHTLTVDGGASELVISLPFTDTSFAVSILQPDKSPLDPSQPWQYGREQNKDKRHFIWRIPNPQVGEWKIEIEYSPHPLEILKRSTKIASAAASPPIARGVGVPQPDFLVEAAVVSDLTMEVFLGSEERLAGKPIPLLVSLTDVGGVTGARVKATIPRTGERFTLFDDGLHSDGAANDGFYGGIIKNTRDVGGYSVIVDASGTSQAFGPFDRQARTSFFMVEAPDEDKDKLADWWEGNCVDPTQPDGDKDPDQDGLDNYDEFINQTDPCDPDTDDGGEGDGSEVRRGADPLVPTDDLNRPPRLKAWAGVDKVHVYFSTSDSSPNLTIYRGTSPTDTFTVVAENITDSPWIDTNVSNGTQYCYRATATGSATSGPSNVSCTIPNLDPHPPHGAITLSPEFTEPTPRPVVVVLDGNDNPHSEEHPVFNGALLDPKAERTGVVEMQVSNRADFEDANWEPYVRNKWWTLAPNANCIATVFARFRDGAGNISDTVVLVVETQVDSPNRQSSRASYQVVLFD